MEKTFKYSVLKFEEEIQSIEKELESWAQMKELQDQLLDQSLDQDFDQVIKLAKALKKLKPSVLKVRLKALKNLKNTLDYDLDHEEAILSSDPVYRRAKQEWRKNIVQNFKDRSLSEAKYQQLFREKTPDQLKYQEEIRKAIGNEGHEKAVRVNDKEKIRTTIKKHFPSPEKLTFPSYENFARNHNSIPWNELYPTSFNWFSALVNRIFNIKSDKSQTILIEQVRKTIYKEEWSGNRLSWHSDKKLYSDNHTGQLITEEEYKEKLERRRSGLED